MALRRAGNLHVQTLQSTLRAAHHFGSPEAGAQHRQKPLFKITDGTKQIFAVCGLIGVHSTFGQGALHGRITSKKWITRSHPKGFAGKTLE
jgi:hypothetical protein